MIKKDLKQTIKVLRNFLPYIATETRKWKKHRPTWNKRFDAIYKAIYVFEKLNDAKLLEKIINKKSPIRTKNDEKKLARYIFKKITPLSKSEKLTEMHNMIRGLSKRFTIKGIREGLGMRLYNKYRKLGLIKFRDYSKYKRVKKVFKGVTVLGWQKK